jgi:hypothetical protein
MAPPLSDLENSIFGRLPPELRIMVYSACFVNADKLVRLNQATLLRSIDPANRRASKMGIMLAPLQVSSQMRREAIDLLLGGQTIIIYKSRNTATVNSPMTLLTPHHIVSWGSVINRIPAHLRPTRLTYERQHDCMMGGHVVYDPPLTGVYFASSIDRLVTAMHPCELVLSVNFTYHKIGLHHSSQSYHNPDKSKSWKPVCARDKTMTEQECEQMVVKFSARNAAKARGQVAEAFTKKRCQLEVHRSHRICFIRTSGIDKALAALGTAENMVNTMIGHLTPASLRYRAAGVI